MRAKTLFVTSFLLFLTLGLSLAVTVWRLNRTPKEQLGASLLRTEQLVRTFLNAEQERPSNDAKTIRSMRKEFRENLNNELTEEKRLVEEYAIVKQKLFSFVMAIVGVIFLFTLLVGRGVSKFLSKQRRLENKVSERTLELKKSITRLRETQTQLLQSSKFSALGEMAGGIAHEINTPLTVIELNADQIKDLVADEPLDRRLIAERCQTITNTTDRIAKIIKGLRTFSRDGSKDLAINTSLKEIITDTLALCGEKFKSRGIKLTIDEISENLTLECRKIEISQVLLNLLNNSYDAVESLPERWIRIQVLPSNDQVIISVSDSGTTIPRDVQNKIFQPFFTTKEIGKGTGLGLSVSKGILEKHGGTLTFDSKSSNTCFVIVLPKKKQAA